MTPKIDEKGIAFSLRNRDYKDPQCVVIEDKTYRKTGHPQTSEQGQGWEETDINDTLNIYDSGEMRTPTLVVALENHPNDSRIKMCEDGIVQTLSSRMGTGGNNTPMLMEDTIGGADMDKQPNYGGTEQNPTLNIHKGAVVRRLTTLECTRLQGFPDGWVDIGEWTDSKGKVHKDADSPKYKALGNSIGLPFWQWLAHKIVGQLKKDGIDKPTMASLFDGIGGFPLVFMRAGCEPKWNSEIEDFPEAVTTRHFGDEEKGIEGDIEKYL